MAYTVSDLYKTYSNNLNLIAGQSGLAREISGCGILDYELLPELKERYFHTNFQNGQFILSSFLYTKDNPYMISDGIKHLVTKGASGLAIRNVLKIQIPETVIRYADSKNFPIFTISSIALPFEEIIYTIRQHFEVEKSADYVSNILNTIRTQNLTPAEIEKSALKLNPSFNTQYYCVFFRLDDFTTDLQINRILEKFRNSSFFTFEDFICAFKKGILYIKSSENLHSYYNDSYVFRYLQEAFSQESISHIGISNPHNTLMEFRSALEETLFASTYNLNPAKKHHYYSELGTYQLLLPFCTNSEFAQFSNRIMSKLEDYDSENNSHLIETLVTYINCDFNKDEAAKALGQHEQTIRYRLNKIYALTNLDRKSQSDVEQLSIACKIYLANRLLGR